MRTMLSKIPTRPLLRAAAGLAGAMALTAVLGTAAAANGVFVPAGNAPSQAGPSRSAAPEPEPGSSVRYEDCAAVRAAGKAPLYRWESGYRPGLDSDRDGVACERQDKDRDGRDGDDGKDGKKGKDGDDGRDGRDGKDRTVYRDRYVTEYLQRGGNRSQVNDGGQVAIYPSGGVGTGVA